QQQPVLGDACVGDQHLDGPELVFDRLERGVDRLARRDVAVHGEEIIGWRRGVVRNCNPIAERGKPLCARQADASGSSGYQYDSAHAGSPAGAPPPQRRTALAAVIPPPNPTSSNRSPSLTRPVSRASANANGTDADEVLPVRSRTVTAFETSIPRRSHAALMMRMLA